jgi:hypothetical protein
LGVRNRRIGCFPGRARSFLLQAPDHSEHRTTQGLIYRWPPAAKDRQGLGMSGMRSELIIEPVFVDCLSAWQIVLR